MRSRALRAALACLASFQLAAAVFADGDPSRSVTIRSYNTFSRAPQEAETARLVARDVFDRAGIEARWRECRTPIVRAGADPCLDTLAAGEVIVRITQSQAPGRDELLGDSHVDLQAGGVLATVFGDRVHRAAARARGDAAVMLGRTVAHEVGHLLMGTARHSTRGLMRAWWSDDELKHDRERDWLFSPRQAARMRESLLARRLQFPAAPRLSIPDIR